MLRNAFTKWLWDYRRSIGVWAFAVAVVGGIYAAFWPTISDPEIAKLLESYPKQLIDALNYDDIATPAGYLSATVYGLLGALLLIVYSVSAGARIIAGDEEAGTLELVAAHPVSRTRLALQRFAAYLTSVGLIVAVFWLVMVVMRIPFGFDEIPLTGLLAMHVQLLLFAGLFGSLAYAVGAATGRRALALGASAAVAVLSYLANGLLPQVEGLEWMRSISPFHWLIGGDPLNDGLQPADSLIMILGILLLVAMGTWGFRRRDIAV